MNIFRRLRYAFRVHRLQRELDRDLVAYEIAMAELNGTEYVPKTKPTKIRKAPISWGKAVGISNKGDVKLTFGAVFILASVVLFVFLLETFILKAALYFVAPALNWNIHPSFYQCMGIVFLLHFIGKFFSNGK